MLIRPAIYHDLEAILEIYNHIIVHTTSVYQYKPQTLDMRKQWFEEKVKAQLPVFAAEHQGDVVGFSSLGPFRNWPAYKYTLENSIYVAENSRGQGIGKLLMQPSIDAAIAMDLHTIVAGIDAANEGSICFHKNFGFTEVAHFKQVGYKFGRWLDLNLCSSFFQHLLHLEMTTKII